MASLIRDPNGRKRITFRRDRKPHTIRLGKATVHQGMAFKLRVEALLAAEAQGLHPDAELSQWVASLSDDMHGRLVRVGLVEPREGAAAAMTLADLVERYTSTISVKPATLAAMRQTTNSLLDHFGPDMPIRSITIADADAWRKAVVDAGYAPATVAKRAHVAKAIFKKAVKWGLIEASPFEDIRTGPQNNPDRAVYVSRRDIERVLDACPDARWRAIVALSRFAGLRCPSEVAALTWADVNWERGRLTVRSAKTAGHEGHAVRIVPIAPELRERLLALFEQAEPGEDRIIPGLGTSSNLRTTLHKIIIRAGLTPWPRLFHNLRASCATDWVDAFPAHAVAKWLGHSPMIAAQHYLQVRDRHFDAAAGMGDEGGATEGTSQSGAKSGARLAQNTALHGTDRNCLGMTESSEALEHGDFMRSLSQPGNQGQDGVMGGEGFELSQESPRKTHISDSGGAKSGALHASAADPRLVAISEVWNSLPEGVRVALWAAAQACEPQADRNAG